MAEIIMEGLYNSKVIMLAKDSLIFTLYNYPKHSDQLTRRSVRENGATKLIANRDLLLVAEGLNESGKSCRKIRFIREYRNDQPANLLRANQCQNWPRLKAALKIAKLKNYYCLGGFENAIIYPDEFAVTNFSGASPCGWIIKRCLADAYLSMLPILPYNGIIKVIHLNGMGEFFCAKSLTVINDVGKEVIFSEDGDFIQLGTDELIKIEVDDGSKIIKSLTHLDTGRPLLEVICGKKPKQTYLKTGRRLPPKFFPLEIG